jgi:integrase
MGDRASRRLRRLCGPPLSELGSSAAPTSCVGHTAAVWMAEAGVPIPEIAQYLGHSNSRTTERVYARYSPGYLQGAARALSL